MTDLAHSTNPRGPVALAPYLAAKEHHSEAERLYHRASRTFDKLAKRIGDKRAYELAGLELADRRMLEAYQQMRKARDALREALRGEPVLARIAAIGAVLCADLPKPANDGRLSA